jgi:hypothetical protein
MGSFMQSCFRLVEYFRELGRKAMAKLFEKGEG